MGSKLTAILWLRNTVSLAVCAPPLRGLRVRPTLVIVIEVPPLPSGSIQSECHRSAPYVPLRSLRSTQSLH
jgi:hypothetical protein